MSEDKKEETKKETGPVTLSEAEAEAAVAKAEYEAAKEEAEDIKKQLEEAGATVTIK